MTAKTYVDPTPIASRLPLRPAARRHRPPGWFYQGVGKPLIDRVVAMTLLVVFLPVLATVALAVFVGLGRPVLYRQPRVGRGGRTFMMLKFRTMHHDRRGQPRDIDFEERRRTHKSAEDPRHTGLGRLLRRLCLDELPQLWNVVRGDMSLVGPRPELESVVDRYESWQRERHAVKPGVTGLWQVTMRREGDADMHLHTDVDLVYIDNLSLRTDIALLLRTPLAALHGGTKGTKPPARLRPGRAAPASACRDETTEPEPAPSSGGLDAVATGAAEAG